MPSLWKLSRSTTSAHWISYSWTMKTIAITLAMTSLNKQDNSFVFRIRLSSELQKRPPSSSAPSPRVSSRSVYRTSILAMQTWGWGERSEPRSAAKRVKLCLTSLKASILPQAARKQWNTKMMSHRSHRSCKVTVTTLRKSWCTLKETWKTWSASSTSLFLPSRFLLHPAAGKSPIKRPSRVCKA